MNVSVQVGDQVVWDRCHLNVTTIIKNYSTQESVRLVVLRNMKSLDLVSVPPLTQYPLLLDDIVSRLRSCSHSCYNLCQIFESEDFAKYRSKRELRVHKGKLVRMTLEVPPP